jgi:hypothetical protein
LPVLSIRRFYRFAGATVSLIITNFTEAVRAYLAMTIPKFDTQSMALRVRGWLTPGPRGAVLLGALLLAWPAFYNGFPLLYPDSMSYMDNGRVVARAIFLHQFSEYYGVRSFFYSLGILPLHWNLTPWPIVALQCLLTAWVIWLVTRSIVSRRLVGRYLLLMLFLSLLTSASWYAGFIMPDILGPLVCLAIYLLIFAGETLSRAERVGLYLVTWWGITAHATHFLLAAGLIVLLTFYTLFERGKFLPRWRALSQVAMILALAAAAQMALYGYLYGKPTLNGERPPYLMGRIIADGPGLEYLQRNCPQLQWTVCKHLDQLTDDADDFLWGPDGAYASATDDEKEAMGEEEMPLVKAALRAYPRQQLRRSAANFHDQLVAFGLFGFDASDWLLAQFTETMPAAQTSYLRSRQARGALPMELFTEIQWWTIMASLVAIVGLTPVLWRRHSPRIAELGLVIAAMVGGNALLTGVLSMVDDRYGCRVIWLIPLLAGVFVLDWLEPPPAATCGGAAARHLRWGQTLADRSHGSS